MSRHFDTWKKCLPKTSDCGLTQMMDGNSFNLWNYRSGIFTRAQAKQVDIGQTNSLFAKLLSSTAQKETQLLNQTSNDTKTVEQLQCNFSDKFVKSDPVRDDDRPLVTKSRKIHLRNKVLSCIYQDANVWCCSGGENNQNSTTSAPENKPQNAESDDSMLYPQPGVQNLQHNEYDQITVNSTLPLQTTMNNSLPSLDARTIPTVTRSTSRFFETWQQSFPRSREDLQTQMVGGPLWYHQSDIIRRNLTESSGIRTNPCSVDVPTASHPLHEQHEYSSDAKEKVIPEQMDYISRVRGGTVRTNDQSIITRSRKLHLKNKVLSCINPDAKDYWGCGGANNQNSIPGASENKPNNAGSDASMLYPQPGVQRLWYNEPDQMSVNSRLSRQTTLNNRLFSLDPITIPIVTRSISRLFETWQQSYTRRREDLQPPIVGGPLWYHQSGIIRGNLTESSGIRTNPYSVDLPTASHPHHEQREYSSDAKEKAIPQQMDSISRVMEEIGRSNDPSIITRSRKLHLKNKVLSHIYQNAKNWWDRGDYNSVISASKTFESKQGGGSLESMAPLRI